MYCSIMRPFVDRSSAICSHIHSVQCLCLQREELRRKLAGLVRKELWESEMNLPMHDVQLTSALRRHRVTAWLVGTTDLSQSCV